MYKNTPKLNKLSNVQKAYIAGIIDGEGCIHVGIRKKRPVQDSTYQYAISTQVSMCNEPVIRWLHSITGVGNVYTNKTLKENRKRQWTWACSSNASRLILNSIKKFLIVKNSQCELVLELLSIRSKSVGRNRMGGVGKNRRFNPKRQFEIYSRMKVLNHRGVSLPPPNQIPPTPNAQLVEPEGGQMSEGAAQFSGGQG